VRECVRRHGGRPGNQESPAIDVRSHITLLWHSVTPRMGRMRVIAGEFRSRRLKTLPGLALRPTPDRLREALFNVLAPRIEGATFLDAYAGSGAVGIEALSRGASHAIFLEKHPAAVRVLRENLVSLGIED